MEKKYYLGLDIGTDSVGYAVTDEYYQLIKYKREPIYGVQTFDAASTSEERRTFRTARRRIDRRQQRVNLLNEIFAVEIGKIDPKFFIRRLESYLLREEASDEFTVFADDDYTDVDYYKDYPTIHHLISELMENKNEHDIRLVYLACAWLVAHRGHFLLDVATDDLSEILNFDKVYNDFTDYMASESLPMPWNANINADDIREILLMNVGVAKKNEAFKEKIFGDKKIPKYTGNDEYSYSREVLIKLLSGGKVKPSDLLPEDGLEEIESFSLKTDEETFGRIVNDMGEKGELIIKLRAMQDCASLIEAQNGCNTISEAKVKVYEQHKKDLEKLKNFVKDYIPAEYDNIFKLPIADNYVSYSYNVKSCKNAAGLKKATAENFSTFLKKKVDKITVAEEDVEFYQDMKQRLETSSFLPKQKTGDNRVIPQQLYRHELITILNNAENYLPMLSKKDEDGISAKEKILSIFDFRIPYFVGPLNNYKNENCWVKKAEGKIYPWNFKSMVDFDASEQAFIDRMTNSCTYLAGETVLPIKSLLYCKYTVLNEINNLRINSNPISVEAKQKIFNDLFMQYKKVTPKQIKDCLKLNGYLFDGDEISGIDIKINSSLSSYHMFKKLMDKKLLTTAEVEKIIIHAAYSEDKTRFKNWLFKNYPQLPAEDINYIIRLNLKEFGRLSEKFLTCIPGVGKNSTTGEAFSIIDALWETNDNLMQILSSNYTFKTTIDELNKDYYSDHPSTLSKRLDDMYISNAVKRPIYRTLDICSDVVKAMGCAPEKIFVEMARGANEDQRGKRTSTRKQQLFDLYDSIKTIEAKALKKEIEDMGEAADNKLQSELLFLYYLQMGKSAYTGKAIDLNKLYDGRTYNREHIYPQSFVKDDSILNNKVLVESEINGAKSNIFPVPADIRDKMTPIWKTWLNYGLITQEKYNRLIRHRPFTDDEKWNFINRQIVETRQSTKAIAALLQEKYKDTKIVYVKAGLVSDFRQEFGIIKCRSVNNLHHAKDAYLNIVVGNVYNSKFTERWFNVKEEYTVNTKKIFSHSVKCGDDIVWQGTTDIAKVKATAAKNCIHVTRFAYCRKGELFDQQPLKASAGLVPLKSGRDPSKYGGYRKPTASFFSLVKFTTDRKTDVMIMPVELAYADRYLTDEEFAKQYAMETISQIWGHPVKEVNIINEGKRIKANSCIEINGLKFGLNGKSGGGKQLSITFISQLSISSEYEKYIKYLEAYKNKKVANKSIKLDAEHDHITCEDNIRLFDALTEKMRNRPYLNCPGNQVAALEKGRVKFIELSPDNQIPILLDIVGWFSSSSAKMNLSDIDGSSQAGAKMISSSMNANAANYESIKLVNVSASGLFESRSKNLFELL